ncbi:MAG: purine-nucleoside phosphorylase [Erysipelotrichaceae bacterium]
MKSYYDLIIESAEVLKHKLDKVPEIVVVLGTGLGALADQLSDKLSIPYTDIPNFPVSTVKGHQGSLVFGTMHHKNVLMMMGRFHHYEGYTMKELVFPFYVFKQLGVKTVILTNACGAINPSYTPGDIIIIDDFINLVMQNPLIGINDERLGPRFPDMTEPYSNELITLARKCSVGIIDQVEQGVYGFFSGPYFETKAEIRAYGKMGCDLIGMSTVPETIALNHMGLKVLAFGVVTNMATGISNRKHDHLAVIEIANQASSKLMAWIDEIIKQI